MISEREAALPRDENDCPFCSKKNIASVTDCFDINRKKVCELWYCASCAGFFPRMISVFPLKETGHDKRTAPRFPVQFVVQVNFGDKPAPRKFFDSLKKEKKLSEPIVAMVLDAGIGGLCFRYPEFIEEGKEGEMRISLPSVATSFSALAKVVRSTRLPDGSFGLGVQFLTVDPEYREALKRYIALD